jgi:cell division protein FtsZ
MGTAVRSGTNRAIEAAQAAMASPLLEAGAIDGARGILINITGSSSLKLSEVNEASSLIQSSAHEDANIIFGAVLDENMGEEVKITVIATGFRDQMPERRARMLSVEETPVVSVPLVSVTVETPDNWFEETAPAPAPPRFMSQDEDEDEEEVADEPVEGVYLSGSVQAIDTTPRVAAVKPKAAIEMTTAFEPEESAAEVAPAPPKFEELAAEPAFTPLPRDYAADFYGNLRSPAAMEEHRIPAEPSLFNEPSEEVERDLDVPAFMRRSSFN